MLFTYRPYCLSLQTQVNFIVQVLLTENTLFLVLLKHKTRVINGITMVAGTIVYRGAKFGFEGFSSVLKSKGTSMHLTFTFVEQFIQQVK